VPTPDMEVSRFISGKITARYSFVRPGELRQAEWAEIDLDAAEWNIPAEKMKIRQPHLVPLARQAVEILRELQPLTGAGRYRFWESAWGLCAGGKIEKLRKSTTKKT